MAFTTTIGAQNLLSSANLTASADSSNVNNVFGYLTSFWSPGAGAQTLVIDHGSAKPIDYWGVVGNLGTDGASIAIAWSDDDISYTTIETLNPTDDSIIFSLFTSVSHRYTKITVTGTSPSISRINVGARDTLSGTLANPFTPPKDAGEYVFTTSETEGGLPTGRSVKRIDTEVMMRFKNVAVSWIDNTWPAIYSRIRSDVFFLLWDSDNRPTETAICWLTDDVKPRYQDITYQTYQLKFNCITES